MRERESVRARGFKHQLTLRALCCLQRLDLGRNLPTRLNGRALAGCPLLQSLVLCGNKLAAAPTGLTYPLLRRLWLNGNELTRVWAAPPAAEEEGGAGERRASRPRAPPRTAPSAA